MSRRQHQVYDNEDQNGVEIENFSVESDAKIKTKNEFSFIDWTTESSKQSYAPTVMFRKWAVILVSAILMGYVTGFIDFSSTLLNDFRKGVCNSRSDKWSLANPYSTCLAEDWRNWSELIFSSDSIFAQLFFNFPIYLCISSACAFFASYFTVQRNVSIRLSGIPEIKMIIYGLDYEFSSILSLRTLFYKLMGLICVVASGLWIGKEGPLVQVSCCLIYIFYMRFSYSVENNEVAKRELLSVGVATGIAAGFNAPIGGVLFLLEYMSIFFSSNVMWASFISATVSIIAIAGSKILTDGKNFQEQEMFSVEFVNFSWLFVELVPFIFIGILGGLYGWLFLKLNAKFSKNFRQGVRSSLVKLLNLPEYYGKNLEVVALVFITTLLNFPLELTRMPLSSYLKVLFMDCDTSLDSTTNSKDIMCKSSDFILSIKLTYVLIEGFVLFSYTYGTYIPGGILSPSLVLGATTGRLLGILFKNLQKFLDFESFATCTKRSCLISPSSYAVISAASFMAGITKLTMSVVVITFELTGAVAYVLPIMCSVMISKFVSDLLFDENVYDSWIRTNFELGSIEQAPLIEKRGTGLCNWNKLNSFSRISVPFARASDFMISLKRTKCLYLVSDNVFTVRSLLHFLNDDFYEGYPILKSENDPISLGYVLKKDIYNRILSLSRSACETPVRISLQNLDPEILELQTGSLPSSGNENLISLEIQTSSPKIILTDRAPIIQVLEIFEKLNLNYLIVYDSKPEHRNRMSGFIDRFVLSRLIDSKYSALKGLYNENEEYDEFQLNSDSNDFRNRHSLTRQSNNSIIT